MTIPLSTLFGRRGIAALVVALSLPGLAACEENETSGNKVGAQAAAANPCGSFAPTQTSTLPTDFGSNQVEVDCAAWQTFIALNWRADPAKSGYPDPAATWASFGTPRDTSPTVWESYMEAGAVFGSTLQGRWQAKRPAVKALRRTSKFGALDLSSVVQAGSGNHWLTNQRGDVTYYEIMMNRDEYEFITTQKGFDLRTAEGQLACAEQKGRQISDKFPIPPDTPYRGGLSMPSGNAFGWTDTNCTGAGQNFGDGVGAMEIKAAWTPLPADHSLDYRYKTAVAEIEDPVTKTTRTVTVGLVGLHIIRKTIGQQQWVWATFEHIDNSPDEAPNGGFSPPVLPPNPNQQPSPGYTFFNPNCNPATDKAYKCVHNAPPTPCLLGTDPAKCQPYNAPMQITRLNPVAYRGAQTSPANNATAYAWSLLPANSVFNYYRLIGVQWPQDVKRIVPAGQRLVLPFGNPTPPVSPNPNADPPLPANQILANTALETFQQASDSCLDCHARYAQIHYKNLKASAGGLRRLAKPPATEGLFASDYSFVFVTETQR
jgi:hypothetical protein